ncbi:MAG TPA: response regulator, partial [bacterium]|nr:response regulator [bacterium]
TVLIVEDQKGFRRVYRDVLESAGLRVLDAADGEAGLEQVRLYRPGLVLLDVGLPGLNGHEVLRRIREDASLDGVKVVLFSVMGEEPEVQRGLALGADGYALKGGHSPKQVVAQVLELLKAPGQRPIPGLPVESGKGPAESPGP